MFIFGGKLTHLAISEVNNKTAAILWPISVSVGLHSLACTGMRRAPRLFLVLSNILCWSKWIFSIRGISQGMCQECYLYPSGMNGSWFCLGFHEQPSVSTLSAFSHNSLGSITVIFPWTVRDIHTPMQTICSPATLRCFS